MWYFILKRSTRSALSNGPTDSMSITGAGPSEDTFALMSKRSDIAQSGTPTTSSPVGLFGGLMADTGDRIPASEAIEKQLGLKLEQRPMPTPVIVAGYDRFGTKVGKRRWFKT